MELNRIGNFTIFKVVQASQHQANVCSGVCWGIQCSCMPIVSINWTLFKLPNFPDLADLDSILVKGSELFKFINEFRYLVVEDWGNAFLIGNVLIDADFLKNRKVEINVSTTEIISSCR